jgi:hypothetical protein
MRLIALIMLLFWLERGAAAAASGAAYSAVVEKGRILLLSEEEWDQRETARLRAEEAAAAKAAAAEAARSAQAAAERAESEARSARRAGARTRRRTGGPMYRQERIAGETYRQKYAGWSCSAASLTIALSLLDRRPANQATEEQVIRKLGSNISKKDGLTGRGMDALADVARNDFEVAAKRISSTADVTNEVRAGRLVVLDVRRPVSGGGHYVVVTGEGRRPGTLRVKDPAPDGGDFEWSQKTLESAIRAGGVAVWNDGRGAR